MTKQAQIRAMLLESPTIPTQRAVATALHVSPGYVHAVREKMYRDGEIDRPHGKARDRSGPEVVTALEELLTAGRTFGTVMLDPPWAYGNQATRGATAPHYHNMPFDALKALPVSTLAAPNAHCHLWVTKDFLPMAFALLEAWSFNYKSILVWDKDRFGTGNYWRIQTEFLLLGVRGNAKHFRRKNYPNLLRVKRGRHSRKPDIIRLMIEQVSPGPYLELFGREGVDGWTVFGNQIDQALFGHQHPMEEAMP